MVAMQSSAAARSLCRVCRPQPGYGQARDSRLSESAGEMDLVRRNRGGARHRASRCCRIAPRWCCVLRRSHAENRAGAMAQSPLELRPSRRFALWIVAGRCRTMISGLCAFCSNHRAHHRQAGRSMRSSRCSSCHFSLWRPPRARPANRPRQSPRQEIDVHVRRLQRHLRRLQPRRRRIRRTLRHGKAMLKELDAARRARRLRRSDSASLRSGIRPHGALRAAEKGLQLGGVDRADRRAADRAVPGVGSGSSLAAGAPDWRPPPARRFQPELLARARHEADEDSDE